MTRNQWLIIGAFSVTYFVWGATYLANYWAIETLPIFGMGGMRFLTAGALLYFISFFVGPQVRPTTKQWMNACGMGVLFLSVGTGAVVWAQQWIPTSTTALIISFEPLVVMLMMWGVFANRPPGRAFLGAAVSICGMYLLINQPTTLGGPNAWKGLLGIITGMLCWGIGMIMMPKIDMGRRRGAPAVQFCHQRLGGLVRGAGHPQIFSGVDLLGRLWGDPSFFRFQLSIGAREPGKSVYEYLRQPSGGRVAGRMAEQRSSNGADAGGGGGIADGGVVY